MKRMALLALPLGLFAGAALAQTSSLPPVVDADGNGTWNLTELQTAWPDLTAEGFASIDSNADGEVTVTELEAAIANGLVSAPAPQ